MLFIWKQKFLEFPEAWVGKWRILTEGSVVLF